METEPIQVIVMTFSDGNLWQRRLSLPIGSSVEQSLIASGYKDEFPGKSIANIRVGIFGKHVPLHHCLVNNDRVEIYAPLRVDPKIARRRRAAHREKSRNIKKKVPVNDVTQT